jgi:hypothetical protein
MQQNAVSRTATLPSPGHPLGLVGLAGICELLGVSRSSAERLIKNDPLFAKPFRTRAAASRWPSRRAISTPLAISWAAGKTKNDNALWFSFGRAPDSWYDCSEGSQHGNAKTNEPSREARARKRLRPRISWGDYQALPALDGEEVRGIRTRRFLVGTDEALTSQLPRGSWPQPKRTAMTKRSSRARYYSKLRESFLKENFPEMWQHLKSSGELAAHLRQTGAEAEAMYETLHSQMACAPEVQKLEFFEKVEAFKRIPSTVREIVEADLIYAPPQSDDRRARSRNGEKEEAAGESSPRPSWPASKSSTPKTSEQSAGRTIMQTRKDDELGREAGSKKNATAAGTYQISVKTGDHVVEWTSDNKATLTEQAHAEVAAGADLVQIKTEGWTIWSSDGVYNDGHWWS